MVNISRTVVGFLGFNPRSRGFFVSGFFLRFSVFFIFLETQKKLIIRRNFVGPEKSVVEKFRRIWLKKSVDYGKNRNTLNTDIA